LPRVQQFIWYLRRVDRAEHAMADVDGVPVQAALGRRAVAGSSCCRFPTAHDAWFV